MDREAIGQSRWECLLRLCALIEGDQGQAFARINGRGKPRGQSGFDPLGHGHQQDRPAIQYPARAHDMPLGQCRGQVDSAKKRVIPDTGV